MGRKPKMSGNKVKKFTIFDWMKEIMGNKRPWGTFTTEEQNEFNGFLINKMLSMNPNFIQIVNYMQIIPYSNKEKLYRIYCDFIPKGYIYSPYIKGKNNNKSTDLLSIISRYYMCSNEQSSEYIDILGKDGVGEILDKMGIDEKEKTKLLKL